MKRFAEQLKKKSERVKLSVSEKRDLHNRLVSYMEYHPVAQSSLSETTESYIKSEQFSFIHFNTPQIKGFFGAFALFILILVPMVAEKAVPGDVLYPVKVNFNEEIRSKLAVSPYAKVEWETTRLERRISEARLLASEGKLTDEIEADVALAVKQHSDAAQESIASLRESDSDEAAIAEITFESALAVQSEVLAGVIEKTDTENNSATSTLGSSVAVLADALKEAQQDVSDNSSGDTPSYEKLAGRMESETTRAYELFESVKTIASPDEITDVERRLKDVERKFTEATSLHNTSEATTTEKIADATSTTSAETSAEVTILSGALSDLQKLISFMTDIDVRENVSVEDLVPVTLTSEERLSSATDVLSDIDDKLKSAQSVLAERGVDEKTEKLTLSLEEVDSHASSSHIALEAGNAEQAEQQNSEAQAFLADFYGLINNETVDNETVPKQPKVAKDSVETATSTATSTDETIEGIENGNTDISTSTVDFNKEADKEVVFEL